MKPHALQRRQDFSAALNGPRGAIILDRMPTADDFRREIVRRFGKAEKAGKRFVDILSGEIHRDVGGYPGRSHKMPNCCQVMWGLFAEGDEVLYSPPSRQGASLEIRYRLPRPTA